VTADEGTRTRYAAAYPDARFTPSYDDLLADPELRAVVLATPVPTHFELARRAILAGKDVMVEKPMTWTAAEAHELRDLVSDSGRVLMVGHLLRFHPGVDKLRELVDSGHLGDVHYVYGNRVNLGTIRRDENALWSLGVHDISVVLHLLKGDPTEVWARGGVLCPADRRGRGFWIHQVLERPDRPSAPVVARSQQDAQDDRGRLEADGRL